MHTFRCFPANTIRRTVDQHSEVSNFKSLARPNIELTLWQDTCDSTPVVLPHCSSQRDAYKAKSHNILHWLYMLYCPQKLHRLNVSLKGLAQAKIIKKSVILFWLLNMTI